MMYLMAFWFIFFMRVLMVDFGIFRLVSLLMECLCIFLVTPTMMVIRGSYLVCLCVRA